MRQYLRVNTSNPPGNEMEAARFFKTIFDKYQIQNEIFEYQPNRANVIARLKGDGSKRPVILLNHMDVVTADAKSWKVDPFAAQVVGDAIYGRGALDMKGEGLLQLMAMIILAQERVPLARDVIFLGTADEEVHDEGSLWMIANQSHLFKDAEFLITEGGENLLDGKKVGFVGVDVAEKAPFWLRLTARGPSGHGSQPIGDSAPNRLVRAMARIVSYQPPIKLLPAVEKFFHDIAPLQEEPRKTQFATIRHSLQDKTFAAALTAEREYNYLLRNTISLTVLEGSRQTNVIPNEASCNIDVRLLPGENPQEFLLELKRVIADPDIRITNVNTFKPPNSSPIETELYEIITRVTKKYHPEALITTKMLSGYTESQLYRQLGIISYGWTPIYTTVEENDSVHGNDERITIKNIREGTREFYEVVFSLAAKRP
jgi:acetylornithine deacetylase/succinyl-diaminopimelate desuccinylase-like protein